MLTDVSCVVGRNSVTSFNRKNTMKRRLIACFTALVFLFPAIASARISLMVVDIPEQAIVWDPVCRHKAVYWASMVAEQYPVRIKYGYFKDRLGKRYYHVQPMLYMGDMWWYFKVENDKHVVIITEPTLTLTTPKGAKLKTEWVPVFHFKTLIDYMEYLKSIR